MSFFDTFCEMLVIFFAIAMGYLANRLKEKYGVKEVVISYVGAVIGSHSGPGTVALFFLGQHR